MTEFLRVPTAEHLVERYEWYKHELVGSTTDESQQDKILYMCHKLQDRMLMAPASSKFAHHNAYPGGWLDHTYNVYNNVHAFIDYYENTGGPSNIDRNVATRCALLHDFGKLGDETEPMYFQETVQKWIDLGFLYKRNPKFELFSTNDLTLHLLQHFGLKLTKDEMLAIKCTDGLYDEGNKKYFMSKNPFAFNTDLPYLLHWADHMATIVEKSEARQHSQKSKY